jgi:cation diffusion facilitator CzcD-associated flavoprotein CzcO
MAFYEKHNLSPFVVLGTKVINAEWHDLEGQWHVQLQRTKDDSVFTDKCHVLINGSGVLTKWKWPDIEGLHDFKGTLAHTASWPKDLDWSGKKVAVIGTGSSSIQTVPQIAKTAGHLSVFMRNRTYILPQFGANVANTEADPDAQDPAGAGRHQYTEKEIERFRNDPEYHLAYRRKIEMSLTAGWDMFNRGTELNTMFRQHAQDQMKERLKDRDDIKERLIPDWSPGCRRPTPGDGYLEALIQPNVTCVWDEIACITPTGLSTVAGQQIDVDILICATGFNVQYLPHFPIIGLGGQNMSEHTKPNVYASIASPDFPNYFVINGPRGNWGQGCALPSHEVQMEYTLQCCRKMQEDRIKSMHPKQRITDQLNLYMDAWHNKHSIWAEPCKSWYKDQDPNGRIYIWPGSMLHHLKFLKRPRYEHYEICYRDEDNVFAFLGNGRTIGQVRYGKECPVPYIRNVEGEGWEIE